MVFSDDFQIDTIILFDISADLDCIKEKIVSKWFLQSTCFSIPRKTKNYKS